MSVRRIMNVFRRDLSNSLRDKMVFYILIAPILMAFVFRFFVPDVQTSTLKFAVLNNTNKAVTEQLERYGKVFGFKDYDSLEKRVKQYDDVIGVVVSETGYPEVVAQGNESAEAGRITQLILQERDSNIPGNLIFSESDIGSKLPPFTMFSFIFVIMTSFLMGGLAIGFNIIEEKESDTVKALGITPMTRGEFLVGKSVTGLVMPVIHAILGIWILGITNIDYGMLLVITISSSLIGIVMGFLIGVLSSNQMNGIANMKVTGLIRMRRMMLAFILPENRHIFLYWAPTYWTYAALRDLILQLQTWSKLLPQLAGILLTTLLLMFAVGKKVRSGLSNY